MWHDTYCCPCGLQYKLAPPTVSFVMLCVRVRRPPKSSRPIRPLEPRRVQQKCLCVRFAHAACATKCLCVQFAHAACANKCLCVQFAHAVGDYYLFCFAFSVPKKSISHTQRVAIQGSWSSLHTRRVQDSGFAIWRSTPLNPTARLTTFEHALKPRYSI